MTTASLISDLVTSFKAEGRIVIVGASLAGLRCAEALRDEGFTGSLTIIGDEVHEPYDRPPLSKQVLKGWVPAGNTKLPRMRAIDADWRLGVAATGLDRDNHEVLLANGADVNVKDNSHDEPSRLAAYSGRLETAKLLLANGADVNARGRDRKAPFGEALLNHHSDVAEVLQQHGGHK